MKVTICGSMSFAKEMLEAQKELKKIGHEGIIAIDTEECVENPGLNMDVNFCLEKDVMMDHFQKIESSDAILVLNHPKNGVDGYIGGATLMEIGLAYYLGKKIFLLHDVPSEKNIRYALEIKLSKPIILKGDLSKISSPSGI